MKNLWNADFEPFERYQTQDPKPGITTPVQSKKIYSKGYLNITSENTCKRKHINATVVIYELIPN